MTPRVRAIRRERRGDSFVYVRDGRIVRDGREIRRIEKLAIPPAWEDVEIARSRSAKVQARGRDAAGRLQAIYHPAYRARREREKYRRMLRFARRLPHLRKQLARDLRRRGMPEEKIVACVVRLMDEQFFRVGNERYAREHRSYGVTTLRDEHVRVSPTKVVFDFTGKSGKRQRRVVRDRTLATLVARLRELPGHELFRFVDEEGEIRGVTSGHVNAYIRRHAGREFSAKDFRTWGGTLLAAAALLDQAEDDEVSVSDVIASVAERLGNTPAVARQSYIHPALLDLASDAQALARLRATMVRMKPRAYLSAEERCVLRALEAAG